MLQPFFPGALLILSSFYTRKELAVSYMNQDSVARAYADIHDFYQVRIAIMYS